MQEGRFLSGRIPMLAATGQPSSPVGTHAKIPMMGAPGGGIQERLVGRPRQPVMPRVALGPGGRVLGDLISRQDGRPAPSPNNTAASDAADATGVPASSMEGGVQSGGGIQDRLHWRGPGLAARSSGLAVHTPSTPSHYAALGVTRNFSEAELKEQYRLLALRYLPVRFASPSLGACPCTALGACPHVLWWAGRVCPPPCPHARRIRFTRLPPVGVAAASACPRTPFAGRVAITWQSHGNRMAITRQSHGNHMAIT